MISEAVSPSRAFQWTPQPAAERLIGRMLQAHLDRTPLAADLARRMRDETGTRLVDWTDHLLLPDTPEIEDELLAAGFELMPEPMAQRYFVHLGGIFPRVLLGVEGQIALAFRVESIADFAAANGLELTTAQPPLSSYRRLLVGAGEGTTLWAIERHGYQGFDHPQLPDAKRLTMPHHLEQFRTRRRGFADDREGFEHLAELIQLSIDDCGANLACDLFFTAEREFWQRRNRAAQVQKARQDRLGLGWANHDHHTYRSSREHFTRLIAALELLGFHCRERF
jgi:hypothetical protein